LANFPESLQIVHFVKKARDEKVYQDTTIDLVVIGIKIEFEHPENFEALLSSKLKYMRNNNYRQIIFHNLGYILQNWVSH